MNNRRSASEQLIFNFLLSFLAVWFLFQYFNAPKQGNVPARQAQTLKQAFQGIDPSDGARLTSATAAAEITKLQKNITDNPSDALAQWSRLRIGLIQQYIVGTMAPVTIPGGFFARSWQGTVYDEIIQQHGTTDIDAQALYQKGDMLWREGKAKDAVSHDAIYAFETILQHSRSSKEFNDVKIFVQTPDSTKENAAFTQQTISQILGGPGSTDTNSLLVRIDNYYQTSGLYRTVDTVVKFFGNQPAYSYGLTILVLAILTRVLMQPLTRKQYESMKGMSVIAPEMKKIQDKYKGKTDQQAQMQMVKEIQELQRSHGVSPMLGCGLGLLQIPFFFYIVSPAMKHYEAKMELVGASFLWIHNLARPDIVLLVFYGITMFVSFRISSVPPTDETQRQQQKIMMMMMPVFPFFLLHYPSAFPLYWMIFNITSTVLQYRMMKETDPEKRLIKSIIGSPAPISAPEPTNVVPPRPKNGPKRPKTNVVEGELVEEAGEGFNGPHKNGSVQVKGTSDATPRNGSAKDGAKSGGSQRARKKRN